MNIHKEYISRVIKGKVLVNSLLFLYSEQESRVL